MVNFLSTASWPKGFYNANFPPYISPSEYRAFQKQAPQKGPSRLTFCKSSREMRRNNDHTRLLMHQSNTGK